MPSPASHPSFRLTKSTQVPEVGGVVNQYVHTQTGAQIISVVNDDSNKVFCATFRTPVSDATGVAHIIEHSVLNGSRKYRAKEPFSELIRGSVNTFVNAFTYPDKTCYPVASENTTDLYNMIDVYLDAIFFPLLTQETFMQEAWHYEYDSDNESLAVSGVVLNEMKGAYASPGRWESGELGQALMPDSSYAPDSGGDPLEIPNLSYKQFKDFHVKYYHPSNARIFFWGDDPEIDRLNKLSEYLDQFDKQLINSEIQVQKRFTKPRQTLASYPAIDGNLDRGRVILAWLLPDLQSSVDWLAWDVLEYLLLGTSTSPLRKALIDSGLGSDLTATGWESEIVQHYFSVGLKDVPQDKFNTVESVILETLQHIVDTGFSNESITAALNSTEFNYREMNTGSYPRGLVAALRCLATWLYDGDPLIQLQFESDFIELRKRIKQSNYFEQIITASLLQNQHKVRLDLSPQKDLLENRQKQEASRLQEKLKTLSTTDKRQIIDQTKILQDLQNAPEDPAAIAAIPRLHVADLDKNIKITPTEMVDLSLIVGHSDKATNSNNNDTTTSTSSQVRVPSLPQNGEVLNLEIGNSPAVDNDQSPPSLDLGSNTTLLIHPLDTNGLIYLDYFWSLDHLRLEQIPLLNLFSSCLLELGTTKTPIEQLLQRIDTYTGGLTLKLYAGQVYQGSKGDLDEKFDHSSKLGNLEHWKPIRSGLIIRGKALPSYLYHLPEIIYEVIQHLDFTQRNRISQLLDELIADLETSLIPNGHRTILRRLKSQLDAQGWWSEQISGVDQLHYLRELRQQWGAQPEQIIDQLQILLTDTFAQPPQILNLTADPDLTSEATNLLQKSFEIADSDFPPLTRDPQISNLSKKGPQDNDSKSILTHRSNQDLSSNRSVDYAHGSLLTAEKPATISSWAQSLRFTSPRNQLIIGTTDMNYVGALASLGDNYTMNGRDLVAAQYISRYYIWNEIRVKNGAYGGMAGIDPISGQISLVSYRDPHLEQTLQTFDRINQHLSEVDINSEDTERLIIGTISSMDQYQLPDARGYAAMIRYLSGITDAERQAVRDQVLSFKADQLKDFQMTILNRGVVTNTTTSQIPNVQVTRL